MCRITLKIHKFLLKRKRNIAEKKSEDGYMFKHIIRVALYNGVLWVWCSYLLAFLDRSDIAEGLSKVALADIIGTLLVYALKSLPENLSKHNSWPDKNVASLLSSKSPLVASLLSAEQSSTTQETPTNPNQDCD